MWIITKNAEKHLYKRISIEISKFPCYGYNVERRDFISLVYVTNKKNGTTYVYESPNYWNKEKKQSRSKRVHIGKLDEVRNPNPSKLLATSQALAPAKQGLVPSTVMKRSY